MGKRQILWKESSSTLKGRGFEMSYVHDITKFRLDNEHARDEFDSLFRNMFILILVERPHVTQQESCVFTF